MRVRLHHRNALLALLLSVLAVLALAACGGDDGKARSGAASSAQSDGYRVTVKNCDQVLTFDKAPSRVLTTYQPAAEIMVGLGLGDRVIGRFAEDLKPLPDQAAAMKTLPVVSDDPYSLGEEDVLALRPDFLLSVYYYGKFAPEGAVPRNQLKRAGAQAYEIDYCTDKDRLNASIKDVYTTIRDVGRIFGVRDRAELEVRDMRARVSAVRNALAGQPPVDTLVVGDSSAKGVNVLASGLSTDLIRLAGGRQIFGDDKRTGSFLASSEEVAAVDPKVYMLPQYKGSMSSRARLAFMSRTFPKHSAARDRRFVANDGFAGDNASWRAVELVERLARAFHPGAFAADGSGGTGE